MKNIVLVIVAIIIAFVTTAYIKKRQVPARSWEFTNVKNYCCPKCNFYNTEPGKCPDHNIVLLKEGTFYCENDYSHTSNAPCKCSDGKLMKMAIKRVPEND